MRILLALAHYFRAEPNSRYSSTQEEQREKRKWAIQSTIESWRGHFGAVTIKNHASGRMDMTIGKGDELHIAALVNGEDHLLDESYCRTMGIHLQEKSLENPRMLGFEAQQLFADSQGGYDFFIYSEDDLKPPDGNLLWRIIGFQQTFGWRRLLLPNRYEWNKNGHTLKTYIDGDLPPDWLRPYEEKLPDDVFLHQYLPGCTITYQRATNPHAGFFAITSEQLWYWMRQPHFLDRDCSFESPLASAASLGTLKTFSIYKSFGRGIGWCEIEHLDDKFSNKNRPASKGGK